MKYSFPKNCGDFISKARKYSWVFGLYVAQGHPCVDGATN